VRQLAYGSETREDQPLEKRPVIEVEARPVGADGEDCR